MTAFKPYSARFALHRAAATRLTGQLLAFAEGVDLLLISFGE